jgi:FkbM family methyltransferase
MGAQQLKDLARRFGWEISHYRPLSARVVARAKDRAPVVIDVGANRGHYGQQLRDGGYGGEIVSFEPVSAAFAELEKLAAGDPLWRCHRLALGSESGEVRMNVASNLDSSSVLDMEDAHRAAAPTVVITGAETVPIARLDDVLDDDRPCLLKLDVQGYEDRVLDGAPTTLARTVLLQCELSLDVLYGGQARLRPMIDRLDDAGFDLVDLDPFFYDRRDGRVLSFDAVFARR